MILKKNQNYHVHFFLKPICVILILFFINLSFSQDVSSFENILYSKKKTSEISKSVDSLISILQEKQHDSLDYIYNQYAYWWLDNKNPRNAIINAEKAWQLSQQNPFNDIESRLYYLYDLGVSYYEVGNLLKSIEINNQILKTDNTSGPAENAYYQLGKVYLELKDYYKAYNYFKSTISLLKKNGGRLYLLKDSYQNLSIVCFILETENSLREGIHYGKKADSLAIIRPSLKKKFGIKLNLGLLYDNKKESRDEDKALKYFNEALAISLQIKDTTKVIRSYQALGDFYDVSDPEKSIQFYNKAIILTSKEDTFILAQLYNGLGFAYNTKKEYEKSLSNRHKALKLLIGNDFLDDEKFSKSKLLKLDKKNDLRFFLQQQAETYLDFYEEENNLQYLEKSLDYFKMTDFLIDQLKINSRNFRSRLFWRELSTNVYGKAIRAAYLQENVEDVFYFMEKNKALLLMEDIGKEKFKRAIKLPSKITQKEIQLKEELVQLKISLLENEVSKKEYNALKKREVDLNLQLNNLEDSLEIRTRFNFEPQIHSLKDVQKEMTDNEVRIEYHISIDNDYDIYSNKENGYVLFITKNEDYLFEINELSNLKTNIETLLTNIKKPFKTEDDIKEYTKLSNDIYHKLFPSDDMQKLIKGKKITIIPDSYLSLLPFEALSTSNEEVSYLIKQSEIHYIYSNSFLKNIKQPQEEAKYTFLGIAPVVFKNSELSRLAHSKTEIEQLSNYYPGKTFIENKATKETFVNELPHHQIIHLATHADAENVLTPWIAFNDEKITLDELYQIKNKASLVLLSGCNTNIGTQEIGEGIMSLARGFFYSGSRSVMASLWNINDKSTSMITSDFYKNLKEGQTKSLALHNAKLSYLNSRTLNDASPSYWASLILLGDNDTLNYSSSNYIFYLKLVGLLLFLIFMIIFFKKNR